MQSYSLLKKLGKSSEAQTKEGGTYLKQLYVKNVFGHQFHLQRFSSRFRYVQAGKIRFPQRMGIQNAHK